MNPTILASLISAGAAIIVCMINNQEYIHHEPQHETEEAVDE